MQRSIATVFGLVLLARMSAGALVAQESPLVLTSPQGAEVRFEARGDQWTWTQLLVPGATEARAVQDVGSPFAANGASDQLVPEWNLVPQDDSTKLVFEQETPLSGLRFRRIFSFGTAAAVLRIARTAYAHGGTPVDTRVRFVNTAHHRYMSVLGQR